MAQTNDRAGHACHPGRVHLRASVAAAALTCLLLSAGCGGGGGDDAGSSQDKTVPKPARPPARPPATTPGRPPAPGDPLALPAGVPRSADGPADGGATRTIRRWTNALRAGQIDRAAGLWGSPAKVQNGTPVITLRTSEDVLLFNDSLSCGAVLTSTGGARGYTIATFRLTERPGGQCGSGVGARARTAIRVRDGRIVAWYRLPETPPAPVV
jgi:hypothetical protein